MTYKYSLMARWRRPWWRTWCPTALVPLAVEVLRGSRFNQRGGEDGRSPAGAADMVW